MAETFTPARENRVIKMGMGRGGTPQAFVAMWFGDEVQDAYDKGFEVGISEAGYDPIRIDLVDHIGKSDDEIVAQIRSSRFVVADFTGHRGGIYFEAGFALGLNLPVIWTCRQDHLGDLHFDIRQYGCIVWEKPEELAERLDKEDPGYYWDGTRRFRWALI